eukprot:snap_masked-scaffold_54-processed-gene-0.29-mRNA-1 protein AED:1.00 eAED:1.00 QI:0/0/0/0/1/1/2/0/60
MNYQRIDSEDRTVRNYFCYLSYKDAMRLHEGNVCPITKRSPIQYNAYNVLIYILLKLDDC